MSAKSTKQKSNVRRQFTEEFKREAVQMLLDGHSAPSVVEEVLSNVVFKDFELGGDLQDSVDEFLSFQ